jgi:hypothetical protein
MYYMYTNQNFSVVCSKCLVTGSGALAVKLGYVMVRPYKAR